MARENDNKPWVELPVALLMDDNYRQMEPEHIAALARKIDREGFRLEHGLPIVRLAEGQKYWIVSGHHRIAAVRQLGWETVPCVVIDASQLEGLVRSIDANSARRDAGVADEAEAFGRLAAGGMGAEEIGERIGRSAGYVHRRLSLLALDPAVRHVAGRFGFAWAEALTQLGQPYQREAIRVLDNGPMTLEQFRRVVDKIAHKEAADTEAQQALLSADWGLTIEEWGAEVKERELDDGRERVVGIPEACSLFGWRRESVREWMKAGVFPEPVMVVNRGPAWFASTLREWWALSQEALEERAAAAVKAWETRRRMARGE